MKYVLPLTIDFSKSHNSYLFDKKTNQKYLDFFSMYSSLPLGYNHPIFNNEFKEKINQISYIKMANNVCKSNEFVEFFELFKKYTFSENIHFTCTGALAVESALKCAIHYKKVKNPLILSVKNSFHGVNAWGFTTSRVGITAKRMEYFPQNNWQDLELDEIISYLKNKNTNELVAVIIEPIQCTNGDIYLNVEKLHIIKELCNQKDICFILDEIQTGFGMTGKMWYYEHIKLEPDILVFGKKAQVSGIVVNEKYKDILENSYQKLDVTFDGDLIDMVRTMYILRAYEKYDLLNNVQNNSKVLRKSLEKEVLNYRSIGHLIAFDFLTAEERDKFVQKCFETNVLINKGGEKSIRLRPNLALNEFELQQFIKKVLNVLK